MTLEQICKLAEQYSISRVVLHPDGTPQEVEFAPTLQVTGETGEPPGKDELSEYEQTLRRMSGKKGKAA